MKGEERVGKGRGEGGGNEKGGGGIGPHFLGQVYALLNKRITYLLTYLLTYILYLFYGMELCKCYSLSMILLYKLYEIIKPLLATTHQRERLNAMGPVHCLSVCLSVCLLVCLSPKWNK